MNAPDTSVDIYERLVAALEALPHGFGRTKSGVEIKLIKKAFMPEEVWLAGQLTRFPETAADIAQRVGRDVAEVTALLESLVPRGLVSLPGQTAGAGVLSREKARLKLASARETADASRCKARRAGRWPVGRCKTGGREACFEHLTNGAYR